MFCRLEGGQEWRIFPVYKYNRRETGNIRRFRTETVRRLPVVLPRDLGRSAGLDFFARLHGFLDSRIYSKIWGAERPRDLSLLPKARQTYWKNGAKVLKTRRRKIWKF
jgi:hypothetical protein